WGWGPRWVVNLAVGDPVGRRGGAGGADGGAAVDGRGRGGRRGGDGLAGAPAVRRLGGDRRPPAGVRRLVGAGRRLGGGGGRQPAAAGVVVHQRLAAGQRELHLLRHRVVAGGVDHAAVGPRPLRGRRPVRAADVLQPVQPAGGRRLRRPPPTGGRLRPGRQVVRPPPGPAVVGLGALVAVGGPRPGDELGG